MRFGTYFLLAAALCACGDKGGIGVHDPSNSSREVNLIRTPYPCMTGTRAHPATVEVAPIRALLERNLPDLVFTTDAAVGQLKLAKPGEGVCFYILIDQEPVGPIKNCLQVVGGALELTEMEWPKGSSATYRVIDRQPLDGAPASTGAQVAAPAPAGPEPAASAAAGAPGCTKDTECKGDRICQDGECVAPAPAAAEPSPVEPGCTKDTECKGDRICRDGRCVAP